MGNKIQLNSVYRKAPVILVLIKKHSTLLLLFISVFLLLAGPLSFRAVLDRQQGSIVQLHVPNSAQNGVDRAQWTENDGDLSIDKQRLLPEVWARGPIDLRHRDAETVVRTRALLGNETLREFGALCGRTLYHSLTYGATAHDLGHWVFISTGDIPDMWIRDSAVQMGIYLGRIRSRPALRRLVEGALRTQAFFITQDPYANAYSSNWRGVKTLSKFERLLGRGGWVATRNYELDSGAYFINLLWNYYVTPGVFSPEQLIGESVIFDAVSIMVDTWRTEQHHEEKSSYRYSELPRDGIGNLTGYTGMTWSGFRPSDDPAEYGYNVPGNMYAAGALQRVLALNSAVWKSSDLKRRTEELLSDIETGIRTKGVVEVEPGVRMYAYEVDGLGGNLTDFDDANVPSLLAIPLLGWDGYDREIYKTTRARLLNPETNEWYFRGDLVEGIGSPHTGKNMVWPMSLMIQALTSDGSVEEIIQIVKSLLKMQCGNGLMHESVDVNNMNHCTRPVFEWANALAVVLGEHGLGLDCDAEAEVYRLMEVKISEEGDTQQRPRNGGQDLPLYYQRLEAEVSFEVPAKALSG